LEARLTEEPTQGRANRQLVRELAITLGVPASQIQVIKGEKSGRKLLLVKGIKKEMVASILAAMLEKQRESSKGEGIGPEQRSRGAQREGNI